MRRKTVSSVSKVEEQQEKYDVRCGTTVTHRGAVAYSRR
jgi:hypothetical protein